MPHFRAGFLLVAGVLFLVFSFLSGCARAPDLDDTIRDATGSYRFSLLDWELRTLTSEVFQRPAPYDDKLNEKLLERRIREAFFRQGIYHPAFDYISVKFSFPPVNIRLAPPPHLLVVSPRDRIDKIRSVTLIPDMDEEDMAAIEEAVDGLGYSSLVVELGGLATFPSYISREADIRFIVETAAHEWVHHYLAFTPLGFRYVLDTSRIRPDYDIATMNETVADIIGKEIGDIVYREYYAPPGAPGAPPDTPDTGFDFNAAMREIRRTVDTHLSRGEIEAAEAYMARQRLYLAANGYRLRKLNQAYFAFHGTYADSPASISPIGTGMKKLRAASTSLKEFLDRVSGMTGSQDLAEAAR